MYLVVPIPKSPHSAGRWGKREWQDWYHSLVKAVRIARQGTDSEILILTAFQAKGDESEAFIYRRAIRELTRDTPIHMELHGLETIEQVERAIDIAREMDVQEVVFVSTFLHYPRVLWHACRALQNTDTIRVRHVAAFGIPRPREVITDIVLIALAPMLDILGLRGLFKALVKRRRIIGKF